MQKDENIRWRYMSEENVEQERSFRQQRRRFYQDIGAYLKKHRQNRHCSQSRLAAQIGCSPHDLYAFEAGIQNISLWYFVRACRVLRLDFRFDQSFRLEPEERQWVEALRRNDYIYVRIGLPPSGAEKKSAAAALSRCLTATNVQRMPSVTSLRMRYKKRKPFNSSEVTPPMARPIISPFRPSPKTKPKT